ncbi:MAG: hypothetical protein Q9217_002180 [Psora testacea]
MKIVIVGAGIGGLTTYLFLTKLLASAFRPQGTLHIVILEKHNASKSPDVLGEHVHKSESTTVGGALGIAPNGVQVLQDLDEDLCHDVVSKGYPVSYFALKSAQGWKLADFRATNYESPPKPTILIGRQKLWDCLRQRVPDNAIIYQTISHIEQSHLNHQKVRYKANTIECEADLVIGADGVRSAVKEAVMGAQYPAVFEGLVGVGGFIPTTLLPSDYPAGATTMIFSGNGFFGYGPCTMDHSTGLGGPESVWWSTYSIHSLPPTKDINKADVKRQLQNRHANWKDPTIKKIVSNVKLDSIYPTWTTPELPTWSKGSVVLIGDAAHAMQPSAGQGASQALEDAQVLCMLLSHYLLKCYQGYAEENDGLARAEAIRCALSQYERIRKPRVKRVVDRAKQMGDHKRTKGLLEEWLTYGAIWVMGKLPADAYTGWLFKDLPREEVKRIVSYDVKAD